LAEQKNGPRSLTHQDLARFEETLKPPFRRALEAGRVDLLPPPEADAESADPLARAVARGRAVFDERAGRLVVPLYDGGACQGLLVAWGVKAEQLAPQVSAFLTALVETALEMVRLRLAAETDPVTGLLNEAALEEELTRALAELTPAKVRGRPALDRRRSERGLSLVALEPAGMAALLDRYGRRFGDQLLTELARRVREAAPQARAAARSGGAILLLLEGGAGPAGETAEALARACQGLEVALPEGGAWSGPVRMGAAAVDARSHQPGGLAAEAAAVLKARALRALAAAGRVEHPGLMFFGEILDQAGRVAEVMPLNRLRLDLGRLHGLGEGERFQVAAPGGEAKAEVVVVSVAEEEAVAEVVALTDPTGSLRPGDRLRRHTPAAEAPGGPESEELVTVGGQPVRVLLDEVTGLACHRSFSALFAACLEAEPELAAVLVRVEGLEGMREELGRVGADALMKSLAAAAREAFPAGALVGRWAPDTLAALLPGAGAAEAGQVAEGLLAQLAQVTQRKLRAGVAAAPCPASRPGDLLDDAAKALVHAGFLEPGSVVAFDAVSLNISGDALFAQGRLSEAVAEYERGLVLDGAEPNLLNSLGVCYGHLGQMDRAMEYFQRALDAAPGDFMAHYNLGYALMAQGRLAEARRRLDESLAMAPDHADTLFQLGRLAQGEGRPAVHRHLGETLAAAGRLGPAEEAFNLAVKVNPNDAAALTSLAELYLNRGANREIALSLARRAGKLEPAAARHLRVTAAALEALERPEEAAELLGRAVGQHPADPFLALRHGRLLAKLGQAEQARDELTRSLGLEPHLEEARAALEELDLEANRVALAQPLGPELTEPAQPAGPAPDQAGSEAQDPEPE
jgi:tetratricopeptide (TPR) repeat protein